MSNTGQSRARYRHITIHGSSYLHNSARDPSNPSTDVDHASDSDSEFDFGLDFDFDLDVTRGLEGAPGGRRASGQPANYLGGLWTPQPEQEQSLSVSVEGCADVQLTRCSRTRRRRRGRGC
jgi:hypothetical protein